MCGIAGWIDWQADLSNQHAIMASMTDRLYNRGPDAEGMWLSKNAAFGHRRLIVVDPSGGGQPMSRSIGDRNYTMVYNGELYNTEDIRKELLNLGHKFKSHSDTEVLLTAYMEWGEACLEKLNGIFAFAVWDEGKQQLFAARDRLGVKPLFYVQKGSTFLFASELKSLLAHPMVKPEIGQEGVAELLVMGPGRTPGHGVYREVRELIPGQYLVFNQRGLKKSTYWKLQSGIHTDDLETTTARVRELFIDSVTRQLVADVPVCTLLSGGLDSSAITAFAAQALSRSGQGPIHTFSVDYVDNDIHFKKNEFQPNSDASFIKQVSEHLGTIHHSIVIDTPQLIEALDQAVRARDLPGMADIDASLYLFCKEIKTHATVALSGECADEIFGGYPWFYRDELWKTDAFPWTNNLGERMDLFSKELVQQLKPQEYMLQRYEEALQEVPHLHGESARDAKVREMFYLNLTRWMPTLLDRKDRMSMGVGLEVRVPFCDHRMVDYAWNVPWSMKFYEKREKGLLRRALRGTLPDDVLYRKKSPYPKTHNPAYLNAVKQWIMEVLDDPNSPIIPLVDRSKLQALAKRSDLAAMHMPWFGQLMNVPQLFAYLAQVNTWMKENRVQLV